MNFALGPRAAEAGFRLAAFDAIGSTNAEALARARSGDPGRLWVAARLQTAGRGRRGRPWQTPKGNLAASVLQVLELPPAKAATLGFVAGLALDYALRALAPRAPVRLAMDGATGAAAGAGRQFALKWPNDLVAGEAKLAGILLEAERLDESRLAVVAGMGVNVAVAPQVPGSATVSLADLGVAVSPEEVFAALSDAWVGVEALWAEGRGLPAIRERWLARAVGVGQPVAVKGDRGVVRGTFETIDDDGRLIVRRADGGAERIAAGEVHFGAAATMPLERQAP